MSIHTLAQCIGNHQHMPSPGPGSAGRKKVTENGVKRKKKNRRAKQDERWTGERERAAALADRQLRRPKP